MRTDKYDFEHTARAVYIMNPSARTQYDSWEDLREFMYSMAYRYYDTNTSFSTGGFQLTFFTGSDGEIHCRASVSASVALRYAESVLQQQERVGTGSDRLPTRMVGPHRG